MSIEISEHESVLYDITRFGEDDDIEEIEIYPRINTNFHYRHPKDI